MIVTCTSCKTKFRLDSSLIKTASTKVRCSMCGNVFTVSKPDEEEEVLISLDDNMQGASSEDSPEPEPEPDFDEDEVRELRQAPRARSQRPAKKRKKSSSKPYLLILFLILLLAGGGGGYYYFFIGGQPNAAGENGAGEEEIKPRPREPELTVQSTREYFLENEHAGQIFVVEGEVVNDSTFPVSFVLIEGKLYTTDNQVAQSQKAYCGNIMGREELTQYTVHEFQNVMMNREGTDLNNVHILPQARVPFMLVFYNLPELDLLSDYSVEAISAAAGEERPANGEQG